MVRETILIIDDDPEIIELLEYNLSREGFRVLAERTGEAGLRTALARRPCLILLDLMLPGIPGFEVLRQLRRQAENVDIAVIMLTAKNAESDKVAGLELGADDYMTKPFSVRELVARVHSVLRRSRGHVEGNGKRRRVGPIVIDPERHEVKVDGEPVDLTLAEYLLLEALASSSGRVVPRYLLVTHITAGDRPISERNVDVHVAALRRKLGPAAGALVTVRGVGYKLAG